MTSTAGAAKSDSSVDAQADETPGAKGRPLIQLSELSGSDTESYEGFGENPFKDPAVAQHWREVYEKSTYECRHVFDPSLTWSEEEEKRLVRKLDWRVCLWAVRYFLFLVSGPRK